MLNLATKFAPEPAAFTIAADAGFVCAEFWLNAEWLTRWQEIVATAGRFSLRYVPHLPNNRVTEQTVEDAIALYRALDCRALVLHQPLIDRWGDRFAQSGPDVRLAVENHKLSKSEFWDWADKNPGLNLDVEHLWKFTLQDAAFPRLCEFLDRFLERYSDKLRHMHLPGYLPGQPEHRPMYCSREFVFAVWDRLSERSYDGFVVSEVDSAFQTPQDLRMDQLLFARWQDLRQNSAT